MDAEHIVENKDDGSNLEIKSEDKTNNQPTPITTYRKRSATVTSLKQRRHKQLKTNTPPSAAKGTLSTTDFLRGGPSRRLSRRLVPLRKVRDNIENKEGTDEESTDKENEPEAVGKQLQIKLSQFGQTEAVVQRLKALSIIKPVTNKKKKAKQ